MTIPSFSPVRMGTSAHQTRNCSISPVSRRGNHNKPSQATLSCLLSTGFLHSHQWQGECLSRTVPSTRSYQWKRKVHSVHATPGLSCCMHKNPTTACHKINSWNKRKWKQFCFRRSLHFQTRILWSFIYCSCEKRAWQTCQQAPRTGSHVSAVSHEEERNGFLC